MSLLPEPTQGAVAVRHELPTERSGSRISVRWSLGRRLKRYAYGISTYLAVLALWQFLAIRHAVNPVLLPPPGKVLSAAETMLLSGELIKSVLTSLQRILAGFALGVITAVPLGLLVARVRVINHFIEPILDTVRPVPALAFLPLAILWFGIGEASKLFLLWFGTFFVLIVSVIEGVYNFDVTLLRAARNLDANAWQTFVHVLLPGVMPFILEGMRQAVATAFRVIVAAEMIAAQSGIGFLILSSSLFYRSDRVMVGIFTLGLLGMAFDKLIVFVARSWLLRYKKFEEVTV